MAEEIANLSEHQENTTPAIAGVGLKKPFAFSTSTADENEIVVENNPPAIVDDVADVPAQQPTVTEQPVQLSDEQVKAYFKALNIDFDGDVEALKEKLKPRQAEPSEEEKIATQQAEEKAMLDEFVNNGGNIDQFTAWKNIKNLDIASLSKSAALNEMMQNGLTKEEAEHELADRYYLNAVEELQNAVINEDEDETEEEFASRKAKLQKKVDFGAKTLEAKGLPIKQQADQFFNNLKEAIKAKESQRQQEGQYSSKVEEYFSKMQRDMTFEVGERNGQKLDPVKFRVSDKALNSAKEILKDTAKRNEFFFNNDGTLNIENATKLLVAYNNQQELPAVILREGETRATRTFESVFPGRSAYQLGVGGTPVKRGEKGQVAGKGEAQRVNYRQLQKQ